MFKVILTIRKYMVIQTIGEIEINILRSLRILNPQESKWKSQK